MRILLSILASFFSAALFSQALRSPVSSAYELLNTYSIRHVDVFSFTNNTAALAQLKNFSIGAFAENRFGLKELNHFSAAAGWETNKGNFGLQSDYFGFSNFNEYQLGLAYARSLGESFDLGAQFNYFSYRIPSYGQYSTITFQVGAIGRLSEQLSVGIQVYNPVGGYLSKLNDEKLSSVYQFGLGYEPGENVILSATIEQEEGKSLNITGGIFYQFDKRFFARAGIRSDENIVFGAAGVAFDNLRVDIAVSHHPILGFSPGVMVIYQPPKK